MSFSGYDTALEMRRLIETVAAGVVNKLRPRPRYGSVQSIDDENAKCTVLFVGDTEAVEVNTGSLIPSHVGQRVKVEGLGVDKCVTALYGNEGVTVHAASTGPFVKLARVFTGTRKEVTLDASTPDQLKVQFASGGANTNAWVFKSDGAAYYNTDIEANQVQIGPAVPTGTIHEYAGSTAPSGWLLCDGAAVSRTTYAALFAVCGTAFGGGDGSTTFNVPNHKGRVGVGRDAAQTEFNVLGETGGAKTHTLSMAQIPNATGSFVFHGQESGGPVWQASGVFSGSSYDSNKYKTLPNAGTGAHSNPTINFSLGGGGEAHNNLQPYIVLNYIIKA